MRTVDLFIRTYKDTWWFKTIGSIIQVWIWLWVIIWIGYLTLAFFGQLPSLPTHEVPQVPPQVPSPINDLGDAG